MSNIKREPIVIELKDGETVKVDVVTSAKSIPLKMTNTDSASTLCIQNVRSGNACYFAFEPDPVRAAELATAERCKAILSDLKRKANARGDHIAVGLLRDAIAAIDIPPETVSEYERGAEDLRLRAAREATAQACYEVAAAIKALPLTEPASA